MERGKIVCYGCGTIGCGWAAHFLMQGWPVTLYDIDEERLANARRTVESMLRRCLTLELISQDQLERCLCVAQYSRDPASALDQAMLVQESVFENLNLKQSVIEVIEAFAPETAIIASSTSGLLVTDIAARAARPERIVGAHPFNPVYLVPLVEIIKGERTGEACLEQLVELLREVKKEPIVLRREVPGFIANRLQAAMHREARDLVYRGICTVEDVDKAVVYGPGSRWGIIGPHIIFELNGGAGGLRKQAYQKGDTTKAWYDDMAQWNVIPEGYVDKAVAGLEEALSHRPAEEGRTHEELEFYRDKGLAALLRFHGKA